LDDVLGLLSQPADPPQRPPPPPPPPPPSQLDPSQQPKGCDAPSNARQHPPDPTPHSAPSSKSQPRQAMLVSSSHYALPPAEPSSWQRPTGAQALAPRPPAPKRSKGSQEAAQRPVAPPPTAAPAAPAAGPTQQAAGAAPPAAAALDPRAPRREKRQQLLAPPPPPAPAAAAAGAALDLAAAGAVDACATPQGFADFQQAMAAAASCSVGLLMAATSVAAPPSSPAAAAAPAAAVEFFSSLCQLSGEQLKRLKAAAGGGGGGAKRRAPGTAADPPAAAAAAAPSTPPPAQQQPYREEAVALAVLPLHVDPAAAAARAAPAAALFLLPLAAGAWGGWGVAPAAAAQGRALAAQLLAGGGAVVCFASQDCLRGLAAAGVARPPPHRLTLMDPKLLAWLAEPQLLQAKAERAVEGYFLDELAARHGVGAAFLDPGAAAPPLPRLRRALRAATRLGEALHARLAPAVPLAVVQQEMQVAGLLAEMECIGLGFDPWVLRSGPAAWVRARLAALEGRAAALAGRPFNLCSPAQLAEVLYGVLRLPPPSAQGRAAARGHLPTDEASLASLAGLSELPGVALEHRALQNFASKWLDADWVVAAAGGAASAEERAAAAAAAAAAGAGGYHPSGGGEWWPRVRCHWNQTATATGRLSSSGPNLQAVTKYSHQVAGGGGGGGACSFNARDAFVAARGAVLVSADYCQVELRLLAHLSGDAELVRVLCASGEYEDDAFTHLAATWLHHARGAGGAAVGAVTPAERSRTKQIVYGLIYGLSAYGLAQASGALALSVPAAQELIDSFLRRFPGVDKWLAAVREAAAREGCVRTLAGRVRPIQGLDSKDKR
jgi:DNA polymerase I-like protein with 3'-5' exonuclease and polymerase domains